MMPTATMAVMHFKILVRLRSFSNEPEPLRKNTQAIAARIISTDWFDWRNIKVCLLLYFAVEQSPC